MLNFCNHQTNLLLVATMVCLAVTGPTEAEQPQPQETWHLELVNAGGGADYALPYSPICFSPDSKQLAISMINIRRVWQRLGNNETSVVASDLPDSSGIGIWDIESQQLVKYIEADAYKVIRFTADAKSIAALDDSRLIKRNIETGEESATTLIEDSNFRRRLRSGFVLLQNGKTVAVTNDGLELFSESGKLEKSFENPGTLDIVQIELSKDGHTVIADSWYWDLKNDRQLAAKQHHLVHSVFRPGTNEIWGHQRFANNSVSVWDVSAGKLRLPLPEGLGSNGRAKSGSVQFGVANLAFHPNGKILATVGEDSCVHLWNVTTGIRVATLEVCRKDWNQREYGSSVPTLKLVRFSPDGRWLLAGAVDCMSMFDIERLRKQIQAGKVYQLTQYYAGPNFVEEEVTNPRGRKIPGAADRRFSEIPQPGTPVIAVRGNNHEVWYDAVILAHVIDAGSRGKQFSIHFEGYSRVSNAIVGSRRIRPRIDQSKER